MVDQRSAWGIWLSVLLALSGCGDDGSAPASGASSGGSSGSPGAGGGAGTLGGTGGATSGGAGSGGGSYGGSAGAAGQACSGPFGAPSLLFTGGGFETHSLSPTADELEMFYILDDPERLMPARVVVRTRSLRSDAFSNHVELPELASLCGADLIHSIDVSPDGLRLYAACASADATALQTLRVAERPSRAAPFVVAAGSLGSTEPLIGISQDELTLFASDLNVASLVARSRSSLDGPFGESQTLLATEFRNPEPTADGLGLYGAVSTASVLQSQLVFASRASTAAPFSAPSAEGLPQAGEMEFDASPAISADCRTLYFLRIYGFGTSDVAWTVQVARR